MFRYINRILLFCFILNFISPVATTVWAAKADKDEVVRKNLENILKSIKDEVLDNIKTNSNDLIIDPKIAANVNNLTKQYFDEALQIKNTTLRNGMIGVFQTEFILSPDFAPYHAKFPGQLSIPIEINLSKAIQQEIYKVAPPGSNVLKDHVNWLFTNNREYLADFKKEDYQEIMDRMKEIATENIQRINDSNEILKNPKSLMDQQMHEKAIIGRKAFLDTLYKALEDLKQIKELKGTPVESTQLPKISQETANRINTLSQEYNRKLGMDTKKKESLLKFSFEKSTALSKEDKKLTQQLMEKKSLYYAPDKIISSDGKSYQQIPASDYKVTLAAKASQTPAPRVQNQTPSPATPSPKTPTDFEKFQAEVERVSKRFAELTGKYSRGSKEIEEFFKKEKEIHELQKKAEKFPEYANSDAKAKYMTFEENRGLSAKAADKNRQSTETTNKTPVNTLPKANKTPVASQVTDNQSIRSVDTSATSEQKTFDKSVTELIEKVTRFDVNAANASAEFTKMSIEYNQIVETYNDLRLEYDEKYLETAGYKNFDKLYTIAGAEFYEIKLDKENFESIREKLKSSLGLSTATENPGQTKSGNESITTNDSKNIVPKKETTESIKSQEKAPSVKEQSSRAPSIASSASPINPEITQLHKEFYAQFDAAKNARNTADLRIINANIHYLIKKIDGVTNYQSRERFYTELASKFERLIKREKLDAIPKESKLTEYPLADKEELERMKKEVVNEFLKKDEYNGKKPSITDIPKYFLTPEVDLAIKPVDPMATKYFNYVEASEIFERRKNEFRRDTRIKFLEVKGASLKVLSQVVKDNVISYSKVRDRYIDAKKQANAGNTYVDDDAKIQEYEKQAQAYDRYTAAMKETKDQITEIEEKLNKGEITARERDKQIKNLLSEKKVKMEEDFIIMEEAYEEYGKKEIFENSEEYKFQEERFNTKLEKKGKSAFGAAMDAAKNLLSKKETPVSLGSEGSIKSQEGTKTGESKLSKLGNLANKVTGGYAEKTINAAKNLIPKKETPVSSGSEESIKSQEKAPSVKEQSSRAPSIASSVSSINPELTQLHKEFYAQFDAVKNAKNTADLRVINANIHYLINRIDHTLGEKETFYTELASKFERLIKREKLDAIPKESKLTEYPLADKEELERMKKEVVNEFLKRDQYNGKKPSINDIPEYFLTPEGDLAIKPVDSMATKYFNYVEASEIFERRKNELRGDITIKFLEVKGASLKVLSQVLKDNAISYSKVRDRYIDAKKQANAGNTYVDDEAKIQEYEKQAQAYDRYTAAMKETKDQITEIEEKLNRGEITARERDKQIKNLLSEKKVKMEEDFIIMEEAYEKYGKYEEYDKKEVFENSEEYKFQEERFNTKLEKKGKSAFGAAMDTAKNLLSKKETPVSLGSEGSIKSQEGTNPEEKKPSKLADIANKAKGLKESAKNKITSLGSKKEAPDNQSIDTLDEDNNARMEKFRAENLPRQQKLAEDVKELTKRIVEFDVNAANAAEEYKNLKREFNKVTGEFGDLKLDLGPDGEAYKKTAEFKRFDALYKLGMNVFTQEYDAEKFKAMQKGLKGSSTWSTVKETLGKSVGAASKTVSGLISKKETSVSSGSEESIKSQEGTKTGESKLSKLGNLANKVTGGYAEKTINAAKNLIPKKETPVSSGSEESIKSQEKAPSVKEQPSRPPSIASSMPSDPKVTQQETAESIKSQEKAPSIKEQSSKPPSIASNTLSDPMKTKYSDYLEAKKISDQKTALFLDDISKEFSSVKDASLETLSSIVEKHTKEYQSAYNRYAEASKQMGYEIYNDGKRSEILEFEKQAEAYDRYTKKMKEIEAEIKILDEKFAKREIADLERNKRANDLLSQNRTQMEADFKIIQEAHEKNGRGDMFQNSEAHNFQKERFGIKVENKGKPILKAAMNKTADEDFKVTQGKENGMLMDIDAYNAYQARYSAEIKSYKTMQSKIKVQLKNIDLNSNNVLINSPESVAEINKITQEYFKMADENQRMQDYAEGRQGEFAKFVSDPEVGKYYLKYPGQIPNYTEIDLYETIKEKILEGETNKAKLRKQIDAIFSNYPTGETIDESLKQKVNDKLREIVNENIKGIETSLKALEDPNISKNERQLHEKAINGRKAIIDMLQSPIEKTKYSGAESIKIRPEVQENTNKIYEKYRKQMQGNKPNKNKPFLAYEFKRVSSERTKTITEGISRSHHYFSPEVSFLESQFVDSTITKLVKSEKIVKISDSADSTSKSSTPQSQNPSNLDASKTPTSQKSKTSVREKSSSNQNKISESEKIKSADYQIRVHGEKEDFEKIKEQIKQKFGEIKLNSNTLLVTPPNVINEVNQLTRKYFDLAGKKIEGASKTKSAQYENFRQNQFVDFISEPNISKYYLKYPGQLPNYTQIDMSYVIKEQLINSGKNETEKAYLKDIVNNMYSSNSQTRSKVSNEDFQKVRAQLENIAKEHIQKMESSLNAIEDAKISDTERQMHEKAAMGRKAILDMLETSLDKTNYKGTQIFEMPESSRNKVDTLSNKYKVQMQGKKFDVGKPFLDYKFNGVPVALFTNNIPVTSAEGISRNYNYFSPEVSFMESKFEESSLDKIRKVENIVSLPKPVSENMVHNTVDSKSASLPNENKSFTSQSDNRSIRSTDSGQGNSRSNSPTNQLTLKSGVSDTQSLRSAVTENPGQAKSGNESIATNDSKNSTPKKETSVSSGSEESIKSKEETKVGESKPSKLADIANKAKEFSGKALDGTAKLGGRALDAIKNLKPNKGTNLGESKPSKLVDIANQNKKVQDTEKNLISNKETPISSGSAESIKSQKETVVPEEIKRLYSEFYAEFEKGRGVTDPAKLKILHENITSLIKEIDAKVTPSERSSLYTQLAADYINDGNDMKKSYPGVETKLYSGDDLVKVKENSMKIAKSFGPIPDYATHAPSNTTIKPRGQASSIVEKPSRPSSLASETKGTKANSIVEKGSLKSASTDTFNKGYKELLQKYFGAVESAAKGSEADVNKNYEKIKSANQELTKFLEKYDRTQIEKMFNTETKQLNSLQYNINAYLEGVEELADNSEKHELIDDANDFRKDQQKNISSVSQDNAQSTKGNSSKPPSIASSTKSAEGSTKDQKTIEQNDAYNKQLKKLLLDNFDAYKVAAEGSTMKFSENYEKIVESQSAINSFVDKNNLKSEIFTTEVKALFETKTELQKKGHTLPDYGSNLEAKHKIIKNAYGDLKTIASNKHVNIIGSSVNMPSTQTLNSSDTRSIISNKSTGTSNSTDKFSQDVAAHEKKIDQFKDKLSLKNSPYISNPTSLIQDFANLLEEDNKVYTVGNKEKYEKTSAYKKFSEINEKMGKYSLNNVPSSVQVKEIQSSISPSGSVSVRSVATSNSTTSKSGKLAQAVKNMKQSTDNKSLNSDTSSYRSASSNLSSSNSSISSFETAFSEKSEGSSTMTDEAYNKKLQELINQNIDAYRSAAEGKAIQINEGYKKIKAANLAIFDFVDKYGYDPKRLSPVTNSMIDMVQEFQDKNYRLDAVGDAENHKIAKNAYAKIQELAKKHGVDMSDSDKKSTTKDDDSDKKSTTKDDDSDKKSTTKDDDSDKKSTTKDDDSDKKSTTKDDDSDKKSTTKDDDEKSKKQKELEAKKKDFETKLNDINKKIKSADGDTEKIQDVIDEDGKKLESLYDDLEKAYKDAGKTSEFEKNIEKNYRDKYLDKKEEVNNDPPPKKETAPKDPAPKDNTTQKQPSTKNPDPSEKPKSDPPSRPTSIFDQLSINSEPPLSGGSSVRSFSMLDASMALQGAAQAGYSVTSSGTSSQLRTKMIESDAASMASSRSSTSSKLKTMDLDKSAGGNTRSLGSTTMRMLSGAFNNAMNAAGVLMMAMMVKDWVDWLNAEYKAPEFTVVGVYPKNDSGRSATNKDHDGVMFFENNVFKKFTPENGDFGPDTQNVGCQNVPVDFKLEPITPNSVSIYDKASNEKSDIKHYIEVQLFSEDECKTESHFFSIRSSTEKLQDITGGTTIRSIRVLLIKQEKGVYIYSHKDYNGTSTFVQGDEIKADHPNFKTLYKDADSILITSPSYINLYTTDDLTENEHTVTIRQSMPDLSVLDIGLNSVASMYIYDSRKFEQQRGAYLYEYPNFAGKMIYINEAGKYTNIQGMKDNGFRSARGVENFTFHDISNNGFDKSVSITTDGDYTAIFDTKKVFNAITIRSSKSNEIPNSVDEAIRPEPPLDPKNWNAGLEKDNPGAYIYPEPDFKGQVSYIKLDKPLKGTTDFGSIKMYGDYVLEIRNTAGETTFIRQAEISKMEGQLEAFGKINYAEIKPRKHDLGVSVFTLPNYNGKEFKITDGNSKVPNWRTADRDASKLSLNFMPLKSVLIEGDYSVTFNTEKGDKKTFTSSIESYGEDYYITEVTREDRKFDNGVYIYAEKNFKGAELYLKEGEYKDLADEKLDGSDEGWKNKAASIRIVGPYEVELFQAPEFGKDANHNFVRMSTGDISDPNFTNTTSTIAPVSIGQLRSIKIRKYASNEYGVHLFIEKNQQGEKPAKIIKEDTKGISNLIGGEIRSVLVVGSNYLVGLYADKELKTSLSPAGSSDPYVTDYGFSDIPSLTEDNKSVEGIAVVSKDGASTKNNEKIKTLQAKIEKYFKEIDKGVKATKFEEANKDLDDAATAVKDAEKEAKDEASYTGSTVEKAFEVFTEAEDLRTDTDKLGKSNTKTHWEKLQSEVIKMLKDKGLTK